MTFQGVLASREERPSLFPEAGAFEAALIWIDRVKEWMPPGISMGRIQRVIEDVLALFGGGFRGYRACDTRYHDLDHTLFLVPPFCRLALALSERFPNTISPEEVELGVIAVLLHDTGYIREEGDGKGTGGKYTFRHIDRSVEFSRRYLPGLGYGQDDLTCVERMIRCTGVSVDPSSLRFSSQGCRLLGYALGTADLLAQMADPKYDEKLDHLFKEFKESYEYEGRQKLDEMKIVPFRSLKEMVERTPAFYRNVVMGRFAAMENIHRLLDDPATGRNPYLERIKNNIEKLLPKL
jgi:hypothetical protein